MTGKRLRQLRKKMGLTIPEIEKRTGLSNGFLSRVERDIQNIQDATLYKILTRGFDMPASEADYTIAEWRTEDIMYNLDEKNKVRLMDQLNKKYKN